MTPEEAKETLREERAAIKTCAQHANWASSGHYRELVEIAFKNKKEKSKNERH